MAGFFFSWTDGACPSAVSCPNEALYSPYPRSPVEPHDQRVVSEVFRYGNFKFYLAISHSPTKKAFIPRPNGLPFQTAAAKIGLAWRRDTRRRAQSRNI